MFNPAPIAILFVAALASAGCSDPIEGLIEQHRAVASKKLAAVKAAVARIATGDGDYSRKVFRTPEAGRVAPSLWGKLSEGGNTGVVYVSDVGGAAPVTVPMAVRDYSLRDRAWVFAGQQLINGEWKGHKGTQHEVSELDAERAFEGYAAMEYVVILVPHAFKAPVLRMEVGDTGRTGATGEKVVGDFAPGHLMVQAHLVATSDGTIFGALPLGVTNSGSLRVGLGEASTAAEKDLARQVIDEIDAALKDTRQRMTAR